MSKRYTVIGLCCTSGQCTKCQGRRRVEGLIYESDDHAAATRVAGSRAEARPPPR